MKFDVSDQIEKKIAPLKKLIEGIGQTADSSAKKTGDAFEKEAKKIQAEYDRLSKENVARANAEAKERQQIAREMFKGYLQRAKQVEKEEIESQKRIAAEEEAMRKQREKAEVEHQKRVQRARQEAYNYMNQLITRLGQAEIRILRQQWQAAVEYASTYYDKMNEIRVVTGMTEQQVDSLSDKYRKLAREMSVTSTEIAQAAVKYYRQGLTDSQVEERLRWTTMYAKVANIDFDTAAELITASVNAMGEDVQRVVDIFLYLGDSAATSGEEIGKAMQKASAAAGQFGLNLEWLGAYIATVSENLRTAPETIGNAFNTIIARLHSIKETGFNEEDAVNINAVAKALNEIGVVLMEDGEWRNMAEIFVDISEKWDTLDGKTQSYIATVMAGTRQQNVFFSLMKDLAKGIEGGSRAWELYNGAMEAAGTTTEKYAIWQESVTAAQENLNRSLEEMYSNLSGTVLKSFYNTLAGIIDLLAEGTKEMGGMNVIAGVLAVALGALALVIHKVGIEAGFAGTMMAVLEAHPIIAAISAVLLVVGGITALIGASSKEVETAAERYDRAVESLNTSVGKTEELESLQSRFGETMKKMSGDVEMTADETDEYNDVLDELANVSVRAKRTVDQLRDGMIDQATAARILTEEVDKAIEAEKRMSRYQAILAFNNLQTPEEMKNERMWSGYQKSFPFEDFEKLFRGYGNGMGLDYGDNLMIAARDLQRKAASGNISDLQRAAYSMIVEVVDNLEYESTSDTSIDWNKVVSGVIDMMYGSNETYMQLQKAMKEYIQEAISLAVDAFTSNMSETQKAAIRERLWGEIIGPDGILDLSDAEGANEYLKGADYSQTGRELLKYVLDTMVGTGIGVVDITEDDEVAKEVAGIIEQAIAAGLSAIDITNILESMTGEDLADLGLRGWLIQQLEDAMGITDFGKSMYWTHSVLNDAGEEVGTAFEFMSLEAEALMYSLLSTGASAEALQEAFDNSESLDDFIEKLRNLQVTMFDLAEAIKTALENIRGYEGTINDIDTLLSKVEGGQGYNLSDLMALAEEHPELLGLIGDAEALAQALRNIRQETQDLMTSEFRALLDGEGFNSFSTEGFLSFMSGRLPEDARDQVLNAASGYGSTMGEFTSYVDANFPGAAGWWREQIEAYKEFLAQSASETTQTVEEEINEWKALADQIEKTMRIDAARDGGYLDQVSQLGGALEEGGIEGAIALWKSWDEEIRDGVASTFPTLALALAQVAEGGEDAADAMATLKKEIVSANFVRSARYFKNTASAVSQLESGTMSAADAYAEFYEEAEKATTAQEEFDKATQAMSEGTEVAAEDVENLAKFLGFVSADALLEGSNWDEVGRMLEEVISEGEAAFDRLNEAAFINITGTSTADFSAIQNGLISTQNMAKDTIDLLIATGQWKVETIPLNDLVWVQEGDTWIQKRLTGYQQVLKATNANPFRSKWGGSSASTSSGGGGSKSSGKTQVELMLDRMSQMQTIQSHSRSLYAAQASYYENGGYLQGVIKFYELEAKAIEEQTATLEANVAEIETWMVKKQAELAKLKTTDKAYQAVADDLDKLQKAHQDYTLQLIDNRTELDKLTDSIKEQKNAIREMEINLRNTILQAIKDREDLNDRMLSGLVKVENEILELIQKRYETERDLILENTNKQIEALQKERDLLDEQLQLRREQAEEEDKLAKLAELEAKYQRIIADPTRLKEALSIEKEIADLRDEIAWDAAEKEVRAQQEAIDQQIESLEDYQTYIENYYQDLFDHPDALIEEMRQIIGGTDEEIIAWLKENTTEYASATEASQTSMERTWQKMLDDMRGALQIYWDEVEDIITQGDDAIIAFLKENSADYREAGRLQAEAYVDEWMKQLDELHRAYEAVDAVINPANYQVIEEGTGSGGGSGGGSSSSGNSSASGISNTKKKSLTGRPTVSRNSILDLAGVVSLKETKAVVKKYKSGGVIDYTGPAWVDGTKGQPEGVLNAEQFELFRDLVSWLTSTRRVSVPAFPGLGDFEAGGNAISVGDIIVNVDSLNSDGDYEEVAERLFSAIVERMNRGAIVGGIRMTR